MGAYLSDRLFVALAKKVGFPDRRTLTSYRSLQLELVRTGSPVTLFTLAKLKGVLDERQAEQFVAWARQVAACRPQYREDLLASGARRRRAQPPSGVVEVRPTWQADETADIDESAERRAVEALDPTRDHTEELLRLLDDMSVEEVSSSRSRRARRRRRVQEDRFDSDDVLPVLTDDEELDGRQVDDLLESQVDALDGSGSAVDLFGVESDAVAAQPAPVLDVDPLEAAASEAFYAEPSADDCLALFGAPQQPSIEDMDTDVVEGDHEQAVAEDALLELLPEWELEEEQQPESGTLADSALFDVAWDEAEQDVQALEADAALDIDIVDPWADPPTTAAPELGPTNAHASATFVGNPAAVLDPQAGFEPWSSSLGSSEGLNLYDQLASDSGTRQGYQPEAETAQPTISQPTISQPTISQPTISQPTISRPTISQPTISQPTISQPTISQPMIPPPPPPPAPLPGRQFAA